MNTLKIEDRIVGSCHPTYFVADIAANHDGDLSRAKDLIHKAAEAGADAAKFQNFKAQTIVSDVGFRALKGLHAHQKTWDKSVYDVYAEASVPDQWSDALKKECDSAGIHYATSPYDFPSVDHASCFTAFYKIGSGDITWLDICRYIAQKNKPVFLATGASTMAEVERAVNVISEFSQNFVLMQCNTNYTGTLENYRYINLNVLKTYAKQWPHLVLGLSDHTPRYTAVLGAVALGARVIEKHFTDDNTRNGPDHAFSLTPPVWREMVDATRELESALGDGVKRVENNEQETLILQRRSLRATCDFPAGHVLRLEDLSPLRPAPRDALPLDQHGMLNGKRLQQELRKGEHVTPKHIGDQGRDNLCCKEK